MRRIFFLAVFLAASSLRAQATGPNGLRLDFETGAQGRAGTADYFQATRLLADRDEPLLEGLDFRWGAEALWLAGPGSPRPPWPEEGDDWVKVAWDNAGHTDGVNFYGFRFSRLNVQGRLDGWTATLGLQSFDWGVGRFYRPADYFNPLKPLDLWRQEPPGSEALDLSRPLFDDLGLEAALRAAADGAPEWVVRLPEQDLALTLTPSFAHLEGRDGLGLASSVTLPILQARFEGVRWEGPGGVRFEWTAGISTLWEGSGLSLEWLWDGTGEALGDLAGLDPAADYLSLSWERPLDAHWSLAAEWVKSTGGGPLLFRPKATLDFGTGWQFRVEGWAPIFFSPGPLARVPGQAFLAVAWEF